MASPDELTGRIQEAAAWNTPRYTVDQQLLSDGYNPADIDAAWKQVRVGTGQPASPRRQLRLNSAKISYWLHRLTGWLFWVAVIMMIFFNSIGLQILSTWIVLFLVTLAFDHFFRD